VLSYEELLAKRGRLLAEPPVPQSLPAISAIRATTWLRWRRFSTVTTSLTYISARDYEFGREPRTAAKFLTRYADRVLFDTDMERDAGMYRG
jgi:hypothetical protein